MAFWCFSTAFVLKFFSVWLVSCFNANPLLFSPSGTGETCCKVVSGQVVGCGLWVGNPCLTSNMFVFLVVLGDVGTSFLGNFQQRRTQTKPRCSNSWSWIDVTWLCWVLCNRNAVQCAWWSWAIYRIYILYIYTFIYTDLITFVVYSCLPHRHMVTMELDVFLWTYSGDIMMFSCREAITNVSVFKNLIEWPRTCCGAPAFTYIDSVVCFCCRLLNEM